MSVCRLVKKGEQVNTSSKIRFALACLSHENRASYHFRQHQRALLSGLIYHHPPALIAAHLLHHTCTQINPLSKVPASAAQRERLRSFSCKIAVHFHHGRRMYDGQEHFVASAVTLIRKYPDRHKNAGHREPEQCVIFIEELLAGLQILRIGSR